jgi:hypothetical protein
VEVEGGKSVDLLRADLTPEKKRKKCAGLVMFLRNLLSAKIKTVNYPNHNITILVYLLLFSGAQIVKTMNNEGPL